MDVARFDWYPVTSRRMFPKNGRVLQARRVLFLVTALYSGEYVEFIELYFPARSGVARRVPRSRLASETVSGFPSRGTRAARFRGLTCTSAGRVLEKAKPDLDCRVLRDERRDLLSLQR